MFTQKNLSYIYIMFMFKQKTLCYIYIMFMFTQKNLRYIYIMLINKQQFAVFCLVELWTAPCGLDSDAL